MASFRGVLCRIIVGIVFCLLTLYDASAQNCGSNTPSFTIDLTGNPDSVWTSPPTSRNDTCCGAKHPERCIKFVVTLDSGAYGIKLDLVSGALPSGALFYQVSCGPKVPIGQVLCLSGTGPHHITFCKPGNNQNVYQITSVGKPDISDNIVVSEACNGLLAAVGFEDSTIRWTSTPYDSVYNTYLSCMSGCDTTFVTPTYPFPQFITYKVCGSARGCVTIKYCDSATVEFVTDLAVDIQPDSPKVCYGMGSALLSAQPTGGKAPFSYLWSTGQTFQDILGVPGNTYWVEIRDSLNCGVAYDTVYVDSFSMPIKAYAGNDTTLCSPITSAQLNGSVDIAVGGYWTGGNGTFSPNDSTLNAIYTPTAAEVASGSVNLVLHTYGNFSCPGDSDAVTLTFATSPNVVIAGTDSTCFNDVAGYSVAYDASWTYNWSISGGQLISSPPYSNTLSAQITGPTNSQIISSATSTAGCVSSDTFNTYLFVQTPPILEGNDTLCQGVLTDTFSIANYSSQNSYSWNVVGGLMLMQIPPKGIVSWSTNTYGEVSLYQTDKNGCKDTVSKQVYFLNQPPTPDIYGPDSICENTSGVLYYTSQYTTYDWALTNASTTSNTDGDSIYIDFPTQNSPHLITLTVADIWGCEVYNFKRVIVNTRPDSLIIGPDTVCELTQGVEYYASEGTNHAWSLTNATLASGAGSDSISVNFPVQNTNHQLQVFIENEFGCTSQAEKTVVVNTRPDSLIFGSDTVCESTQGVEFYASEGTSHTWTLTNATLTSGAGNDSITVDFPIQNTNHELQVLIENEFGCTSDPIKTVVVNTRPDSLILGPDTVCELTQGVEYYASEGTSHTWSLTNASLVSGTGTDSISVDFGVQDTLHLLEVFIENQFGCTSEAEKTVVVNPRPDSLIFGPDTVCELTANVEYYASEGTSHTWTLTNASISSGTGTDSISVNFPVENTNHGLYVLIENEFGCTSEAEKSVVVNTRPDSLIFGPDTLCELTQRVEYYASAGTSHTWTLTNANLTTGAGNDSISVNFGIQDTLHLLQVRIENQFGCTSDAEKTVIVNTRPDSLIFGPDTVCELTQNIEYYASEGTNHTWTLTNASISAGTGTDSISVDFPIQNTNHQLQVLIGNQFGCTSEAEKTVIVNTRPDSLIFGPDTVCESTQGVEFYASEGTNHTWTLTNASISSGSGTDSILVDFPIQNTNHQLEVLIENQFGCTSQAEKTVVVNTRPDSLIFGPGTVCESTQGIEYYASEGTNHTWTLTNATLASGAGTDSISVNYGIQDTLHLLEVLIENQFGCTSEAAKTIIVNTRPDSLIFGPDTICELTQNIEYYASEGTNHTWTLTNASISLGTGTDSISVNFPVQNTNHQLQVLIRNQFGCTSEAEKTVIVNTRPDSLIFGPDTVCELTGNVEYYASKGTKHTWTLTNATLASGTGSDSISVDFGIQDTLHLLEVLIENQFGCASDAVKTIIINTRPDSLIFGPDTVCELTQNIEYYASEGTNHTWALTNASISSGTGTDSISVNFGIQDTLHLLEVLIENQFGCTSEAEKNIVVNTRPDSLIFGPDTVCELTQNIEYYASEGTNHTWTLTNASISSGSGTDSILVNFPVQNTNHQLQVSIGNQFGCTSEAAKTVIVNTRPDSLIFGPDTVCELTGNVEYYASEGTNHAWTLTNAALASGTGSDSISVDFGVQDTLHLLEVLIENQFGCTSNAQKTVIVNTRPDSLIFGPDTVCELTQNIEYYASEGTHHTWTLTNTSISAGTGTDSISVNFPVQNTNHQLQVLIGNQFGCTSEAEKTVVVNTRPDSLIFGPDTVCELTQGIEYYASEGTNHTWTLTNTTLASGAGTDSVSVDFPIQNSNHQLEVLIENQFGCTSEAAKTIIVNTRPDSLIFGPDTLCELTQGVEYAASEGTNHTWTLTNATLASGAGTDSISVDFGIQDTAHVLHVLIENQFGCTSETEKEVVLNARPDSLIFGPDTVCELTANVEYYASEGTNHTWTLTNANLASGAGNDSISVDFPIQSTNHQLDVLIENQFGCTSQASKNVVVNTKPDSLLFGPDTVCESTQGVQYYTSSGTNYTWSLSNVNLVSGAGNDSILVDFGIQDTAHIIRVYIENEFGCVSMAEKTIIVNTRPDSLIFGPDTVCELTDGVEYYASEGTSHTWSLTNATLTSGAGTDSVSVNFPIQNTSHTLQVQIGNQFGCTSLAEKKVIVNTRPDSLIVGPGQVCELTQGVEYYASEGTKHTWTLVNASIASGTGNDSILVDFPIQNTNHQLQVLIENQFGCTSQAEKTVVVNTRPDSIIYGPDTLCELTTAVEYYASEGISHVWTSTNVNITSGSGNDSVLVNFGMQDTLHQLQVFIENQFGCTSESEKTIVVNTRPDSVIFGPDTLCELTNQVEYYTADGTSHTWTLTNATLTSGAGTDSILVNFPVQSTNHQLQVSIENQFGCTSQAEKTVVVNTRPDSLIFGPGTVCESTQGIEYYASEGTNHTWTLTNATLASGAGTDSISVNYGIQDTLHLLQVLIENQFGCTSEAEKTVIVNTRPDSLIFGPDTVCELTNNIEYYASEGAKHTWSLTNATLTSGAGTDSISVDFPIQNTNHQLEVLIENQFGCTSQAEKTVVVNTRPDSIIYGPSEVCELTQGVEYYASEGTNHTWTLTNSSIASGTGKDSISVDFPIQNTNHQLQVLIENQFGCTSQAEKTVVVNTRPDSIIYGPDTLCELTTAVEYYASAGTSHLWTGISTTITSGSSNDSVMVNFGIQDTLHQLQVFIENQFGCTSEGEKTIVVNTRPDSAIFGPDTLCELTQNVQYYTDEGTKHAWSLTNASLASGAGTDSILVNFPVQSTNHRLEVIIENQFGCTSQAQKAVWVNTRPDSLIYGPDTVCELTQAVEYYASEGTQHTWSLTNASIASGTGTDSISVNFPIQNTNHQLEALIENQFGCTSNASKTVVVNTRPDSLIYGPDTVCELTQAVEYYASEGTKHTWSLTNASLTSGAGTDSITVNFPVQNTNHFLDVLIENQFGCTSNAEKTVIVNTRPDSLLFGPDTVCELTQAVEYYASEGSKHTWSLTNASIASGTGTDSISVNFPIQNTNHKLEVLIENQYGCTSEAEKTVIVNTRPDSLIFGPDTICELTQGIEYYASEGTSHAWTLTNATLTSGAGTDSISVNFPIQNNLHQLEVAIANQFGCTSQAEKTVVVNTRPDSLIFGPDTVCELTSSVQYFASPGTYHQWALTNASLNSGAGTDTVSVNFPIQNTNHKLEVLIENQFGCTSEAEKNVVVNTRPDSLVFGPDTVCELTSGVPYTASQGTNHTWTLTNASLSSGTGTGSISVNFPIQNTNHQLEVLIENQFGCTSQAEKTVTVNVRPDSLIFGPDTVCELTPNVEYYSSEGTNHTWSLTNASLTSGAGTDSISVYFPIQNSNHELQVLIENQFGCTSEAQKTVIVNTRPDSIILGPDTVCELTSGVRYSTDPGTNHTWKLTNLSMASGAGTDSISVNFPTMNNPHHLEVLVENQFGCTSEAEKTVTVNVRPDSLIFGPDTACELTQGIQYHASLGTSHTWTLTNANLASGTGNDTVLVDFPIQNTNHALEVLIENQFGCTSQAEKTVVVNTRPDSLLFGPDTICELTDGVQYHASAGTDHVWTLTNANLTSGGGTDSILVSFPIQNTHHHLHVWIENQFGCTSQAEKAVVVNTRPDSLIFGPGAICELTNGVNYSASPGTNHTWTLTNASISSGAGTDSISVNFPLQNTNHQLDVLIENQFGCTSKASKNITVHSRPDSLIIGPDTVCELTTGVEYSASEGTQHTWTLTNVNLVSGSGTDSISVNFPTQNTHHLLQALIENQYGCKSVAKKNVVVNTRPDSLIFGPDTVCESTQEVSYYASQGTNHSWTLTNASLASGAGNDSILVNFPIKNTDHLLEVSIENQFGCTSLASKEVIVNTRPDSLIFGPDTVCEFTDGIKYSASNGTGHTWTLTNASLTSGAGTPSVSVDFGVQDTLHMLQTLIENQFGCTSLASKEVIVNTRPDSVIYGPDTLCEFSKNITFKTESSPNSKYSWSVINGIIVGGAGTDSLLVDFRQNMNSHLISLQVINEFGCKSDQYKPVYLQDRPKAFIYGPDTLCEVSRGITYYVKDNSKLVDWSLIKGDIVQDLGDSVVVDWPEKSIDHMITVKLENDFGCKNQSNLRVTLLSRPKVNILGKDSTCTIESETLSFNNSHHQLGYSNNWSVIGIAPSSPLFSDTLVGQLTGRSNGEVILEVVSKNGCSALDTHRVEAINLNKISLDGDTKVCKGADVMYEIVGDPTYNYSIQVQGGVIVEQSSTTSFVVQWDSLTSKGFISISGSNFFGCDSSFMVGIEKFDAPSFGIEGPDRICAWSPAIYHSVDDSISVHEWSIDNGEIISVLGDSVVVKWFNSDSGYVHLKSTHKMTSCETEWTKAIKIDRAPVPEIIGDSILCKNTISERTYFTTEHDSFEYTWEVVGGNLLSGQGTHEVKVEWQGWGGYVNLYSIDKGTGCDTVSTKIVDIFEIRTIAPPDTLICHEQKIEFSATSSDEAVHVWSFGDGSANDTGDIVYHWFREPGIYPILVYSRSEENCKDTASTSVIFDTRPTADFTITSARDPQPAWEKEDTVYFKNRSLNAANFEWQLNDTLRTTTYDAQQLYDTFGTYPVTLYAISGNGCRDSITRWARIEGPAALHVPTAFTPNNDGINDYFTVQTHHIDSIHVQIYNRWGERVYESYDVDFQWDGTFKGEPVPIGVYIWIVSARTTFKKPIYKNGGVTVLR